LLSARNAGKMFQIKPINVHTVGLSLMNEGAVNSKKSQSLKSGGVLLIVLSILMELGGVGEMSDMPNLFIYLMGIGVIMVVIGLVDDHRRKTAHREEINLKT
jgi:hypothetical protein